MENWFLRKKIAELEAELAKHREAVEKLNRTSVSAELYDAVVAELNEIKKSYSEVMADPCDGSDDRVHCTCVPVLRYRIAKLETAICLASEEPNIDKARAIADDILMPKANAPTR